MLLSGPLGGFAKWGPLSTSCHPNLQSSCSCPQLPTSASRNLHRFTLDLTTPSQYLCRIAFTSLFPSSIPVPGPERWPVLPWPWPPFTCTRFLLISLHCKLTVHLRSSRSLDLLSVPALRGFFSPNPIPFLLLSLRPPDSSPVVLCSSSNVL